MGPLLSVRLGKPALAGSATGCKPGHPRCPTTGRARKKPSAVGWSDGQRPRPRTKRQARSRDTRTRRRDKKIDSKKREGKNVASVRHQDNSGWKESAVDSARPHEGARLLLRNEGSNQKTNGPPLTSRDSPALVVSPAGTWQGSTRQTAADAPTTVHRWPGGRGQSFARPPVPAPDPCGTTTPA